jgi:hypothetical protein
MKQLTIEDFYPYLKGASSSENSRFLATDKYRIIFEQFLLGRRSCRSFNFAAFFFGAAWFFFRRMNFYAFIIILIDIILSAILHLSHYNKYVIIVIIFYKMLIGIFADFLYFRSIRNQILNNQEPSIESTNAKNSAFWFVFEFILELIFSYI